ncbi:chromo domain [Trichoderma arundinaceum]|uniref:Chromo domain n=1 Tax=Trichoderma arundinaceum TaxID=490622 RepID=A0A395NFQ2_TRIAR|nr:chromo domain [Trichoderma arundinaceum]
MPPLLYDDELGNANTDELYTQLFEGPTSTTFSRQASVSDPSHSPGHAPVSSAQQFAPPLRSPMSPAYSSTRSSRRSSFIVQLNAVGDKTEGPMASKKVGERLSASIKPNSSSERRSASSRKAKFKSTEQSSSLMRRKLRPRGKTNARSTVRKGGRPTQPTTQRKARLVKRDKFAQGVPNGRKEWEVEEIVDSRIDQGTLQHWFKVKWKGYTNKDNTWEPKTNLTNCKTLVEKYEKKGGK